LGDRRTSRRPLYCLPALAAPWTVEGRVVAISDGDTITVLDRSNVQHKIRLSGSTRRSPTQRARG
jgi:endonuclease YncB( thermonuclease family)